MFRNLNRLEKSWVLYDVGNSIFTLMVSTLMPIWFDALAEKSGMSSAVYLANWSYAVSAVTIIVAVLGPILGAVSDHRGFRKPMFTSLLFTGALGCILMGVVPDYRMYLGLFILSKCAYQLTLVLYDSMLPDITSPERMDQISSGG